MVKFRFDLVECSVHIRCDQGNGHSGMATPVFFDCGCRLARVDPSLGPAVAPLIFEQQRQCMDVMFCEEQTNAVHSPLHNLYTFVL